MSTYGPATGTTRAPGSFGVELAGLNCATCHVGTLRETPSSPRQIVLGMPAHGMDLQGYSRFLTADGRGGRATGGLFSLDGVHPTTVG